MKGGYFMTDLSVLDIDAGAEFKFEGGTVAVRSEFEMVAKVQFGQNVAVWPSPHQRVRIMKP
jgi:hypothetical protein